MPPPDSGPGAPPPSTALAAPAPPQQPPPQPPPAPGRNYGFLFIQAEGGLSYLDLTALQSMGQVLPAITQLHATGWGGGATIGFRSKYLALGANGYISRFDSSNAISGMSGFDIGQAMLESAAALAHRFRRSLRARWVWLRVAR